MCTKEGKKNQLLKLIEILIRSMQLCQNAYKNALKAISQMWGQREILAGIYVLPTEGGGHIVFGADPVSIGVHVRIASFRHNYIF